MKKYKKNLGIMLSKFNERFVIQKGNELFQVNEVSARILDLCNGQNTDQQIIEILSKFYNIDRTEIDHIIKSFLYDLSNMEIIREI